MIYIYRKDGKVLGKIEEEDGIGFYLYIYDPISGKNTHDYLQDSLEISMEQAEEDFSIPI